MNENNPAASITSREPLPRRMVLDANHYQKLAARTECNQAASLKRMAANRETAMTVVPDQPMNEHPDLLNIRLNHAVIGMCGETGELASLMQKTVYYGKPFNPAAFKEELGDVLWYVALACNAAGFSMEDLFRENLAKLAARYPDKYTDHNAADENRDREAEARAAQTAANGVPAEGYPRQMIDGA